MHVGGGRAVILPQVQPGGNLSPTQLSRALHPWHPNPASLLELAHLLPGFCMAAGNSFQQERGRMGGALEGQRPQNSWVGQGPGAVLGAERSCRPTVCPARMFPHVL